MELALHWWRYSLNTLPVQLIPHTLSHTTLGDLSPGSKVNIETDILAKYVQKSTQAERE